MVEQDVNILQVQAKCKQAMMNELEEEQDCRGGEEENGATREGWSGQNVVQEILSVCKKNRMWINNSLLGAKLRWLKNEVVWWGEAVKRCLMYKNKGVRWSISADLGGVPRSNRLLLATSALCLSINQHPY